MTFARREAGWGSLRLFFLNPPHPSLTVREGARGLAALWAPANWRNVGGSEALLLAVPCGDALDVWCVERFSPFGYVLLLARPGYLARLMGTLLLSANLRFGE